MLLARLAAGLGSDRISAEALDRVPDAVQEAIDAPGTDAIPIPARVLVLFGEGPAAVTAREGALKVREASRFLAEGYDVEYLLHGSAVPLTDADRLIALSPPDTDGLVEGVARAAESESVPVTRLRQTTADLPPVLAQIPLTARLQLLALRFALERGQNPDVVITGAWADEGLWSIGQPRPR
jgi:glucosamine--fructose-6-phosphate aminotransferase (isomerizing)